MGALAIALGAAAPASAQDDLPDATEARERAGEILAGDEFSGSGEGDGGEIGDGTGDGGGGASEAPDSGGGGFEFPGLGSPGLSWLLYGAIVAAIVALAIWFGRRAVDQEVTEAIKRKRAASLDPSDPDDLERLAEEAERNGETATALRLRFQACLLRLAEAGAIKLRPSLTARGAGRQVRSPEFDEMVTSFESVAYGGHEPSEDEARAARESWPRVVERLAAS